MKITRSEKMICILCILTFTFIVTFFIWNGWGIVSKEYILQIDTHGTGNPSGLHPPDTWFDISECKPDIVKNRTIFHVADDDLQGSPYLEKFLQNPGRDAGPWRSNGERYIGGFEGNMTEYDNLVNAVCNNVTLDICFENPPLYEYNGRHYRITAEYFDSHSTPPVILNPPDSCVTLNSSDEGIFSINASVVPYLVSESILTNASFVAEIALRDENVQEMLRHNSTVRGIIDFMPSRPKGWNMSAGPTLWIDYQDIDIYFYVNETGQSVERREIVVPGYLYRKERAGDSTCLLDRNGSRVLAYNASRIWFPQKDRCDENTGLNYSIDPGKDLQPVDMAVLTDEDRWESFRRSGKIDPGLLDALNSTPPKDYRTLWIVLNEPPGLLPPAGDYIPEETMKEFYRSQAGVYANHTRQIASLVNSLGTGVVYTGRYTPSLAVRIPMSNADELEVIAALNRHPDVVLITRSKIEGTFSFGRIQKTKSGDSIGAWICLHVPPDEIRNRTDNSTEQYRTWSAPVVTLIKGKGYAVNDNVPYFSPQMIHSTIPVDVIEELNTLPQVAAIEPEGVYVLA